MTPTPEVRRVAAEEIVDELCRNVTMSAENRAVLLDRIATALTRAAEKAREKEREWWLATCEDDFPCVTAGTPRGSCKHDSFIACVLDAALRRAGKNE